MGLFLKFKSAQQMKWIWAADLKSKSVQNPPPFRAALTTPISHQSPLPPRSLTRILPPLEPFSLLALLSLLAAWLFLYAFHSSDQPLVIAGRAFSDREILGILVVSTIIVVFLTSGGSLLISALLVGLAVVCVHGAFRMPENFFLDDQEPLQSGLLSFIGGAANAAAAVAPTVASRV